LPSYQIASNFLKTFVPLRIIRTLTGTKVLIRWTRLMATEPVTDLGQYDILRWVFDGGVASAELLIKPLVCKQSMIVRWQ